MNIPGYPVAQKTCPVCTCCHTSVACQVLSLSEPPCFAEGPGGRTVLKKLTVVVVLLVLQGCTAMVVGTTVGVVTTVAAEAVKVPFKVTGAVIDVATDDEDEDEDD